LTPRPLPPYLLEHMLWEDEINPIWPATAFILHRNLAKYNFPAKLQELPMKQILEIVKNALLQTPGLSDPLFLKAEDLSPVDKEFLFEHFMCLEGFQNSAQGQGFFIDKSAKFFASINIGNHLQLQLVDSEGNWESGWNRLSQIETAIGTKLDFAYSPRFGYLTSQPSCCGTGLIVLVYLHLPALIHTGQLQEVLSKEKQEEIVAVGIEGPIDGLVGDLLVLRNNATLGLTEENILHTLHMTALKLIVAEKTTRNKLQQENNSLIKDQVSRAFGLLVHSYQLETKEALAALSLLKLGLDLGWISGTSDKKLNEIFFKCRRAHLAHLFDEKSLEQQEIPRKRAEYLHKEIQGIQLKTE